MTIFLWWLFFATLIVLWVYCAFRKPDHVETVGHQQSMKRAELWLEAAAHWQNHEATTKRFIAAAYDQCLGCGCPADCWPEGVVKIHSGTYR
jgi:hypothetical protein